MRVLVAEDGEAIRDLLARFHRGRPSAVSGGGQKRGLQNRVRGAAEAS